MRKGIGVSGGEESGVRSKGCESAFVCGDVTILKGQKEILRLPWGWEN